jgi:hypothetical protein
MLSASRNLFLLPRWQWGSLTPTPSQKHGVRGLCLRSYITTIPNANICQSIRLEGPLAFLTWRLQLLLLLFLAKPIVRTDTDSRERNVD